VAVVDALADGEALDDLNAHCRCWMGLLLSVFDSGRWFGSVSKDAVVLLYDRSCRTAKTLGTLDRKEGRNNQMLGLRRR
jgi:hypothetical protein